MDASVVPGTEMVAAAGARALPVALAAGIEVWAIPGDAEAVSVAFATRGPGNQQQGRRPRDQGA